MLQQNFGAGELIFNVVTFMSTRTPIAVIIPTYNGRTLLQKNLPSVMAALTKNDQLIIADDNSSDDTLHYLSDRYDLDFKKIAEDDYGRFEVYTGRLPGGSEIKLIKNLENLRFAANVNRAVAQTDQTYFLLINNDVALKSDTIEQLLVNFADNESLFAVGCREIEPNQGHIEGGKNKLFFKKGLFQHQRADEFSTGPTAWASGGSAMFHRPRWLKLGGFDTDFYPAYWEDIDLSFRAKQQSWSVKFEQEAKVIHNHESTNQAVFGRHRLERISWRNADRFTKKHASIAQKLKFLFYKPYWLLRRLKQSLRTKQGLALLAVLIIAAALRFYQLGLVPAGMTWDEAAIGYNGYAVITTRRDEWLEFLPISFKSFDDYKTPLPIYLSGLFTTALGLNLLTIRLPFAIAGVLAVWGLVKLTTELLALTGTKTKLSASVLGLLAGLLLATSPWHSHFSRAGFESGLTLAIIIWGFYYGVLYLKRAHVVSLKQQLKMLLPAVMLLTASFYSYHSAKMVVPLLVLFFAWTYKKRVLRRPRAASSALGFGLLLLVPLIKDSLFGPGLSRAGTLLFSQAESGLGLLTQILYRLGVHLSPGFLVGGWVNTFRHGTGRWGVLLPLTFVFLIAGFVLLLKSVFLKKTTEELSLWYQQNFSRQQWLRISFIWLLIGLLPAILGQEYPQANRALLALPGFLWLAAAGFDWFLAAAAHHNLSLKKIIWLCAVLYLVNISLYLRYYYQDFARLSTADFNEGYIEAMQLSHAYEQGKNQKPEVNKIIFSNQYGQAYIYALLVRKTNPIWYHGGSLNKFMFVDQVSDSDLLRSNTLVAATNKDEIEAEPDHIIVGSDGSIRFKLYYLE